MKLIGEQSKLCVKEMLQLGNNMVNIECEEWYGMAVSLLQSLGNKKCSLSGLSDSEADWTRIWC